MMTENEVAEMARNLPGEDLLDEWLEARFTICAPGYHDFPNEAVELAASVARAEILRRMSFVPKENS